MSISCTNDVVKQITEELENLTVSLRRISNDQVRNHVEVEKLQRDIQKNQIKLNNIKQRRSNLKQKKEFVRGGTRPGTG